VSVRAKKRHADAAAAKQRRQKGIAFGGLGVLAILLVIQGPKLLGAFGGSDSSAAAATPVASAPPDALEAPRPTLRLKGTGTDPFAAHSLADNDPQAGSVSGPGGARDPFLQAAVRASSSTPARAPEPAPEPRPLPKRIVVGTPTPGAVAKRGWIVVLASIQTRAGRAFAERFATGVRRKGLDSVSVLNSSTRKPLRSGYYVVYTGPFGTLSEVKRSAARVLAFGYRTAYVRKILRY